MKKLVIAFFISLIAGTPIVSASDDNSTKAERNMICHGNELFNNKQYHEALEQYEQALILNPTSQYAQYNKAVTLVQLATDDNKGTENDPRKIAGQLFEQIARSNDNQQLAENSYYNLGNMAFNDQDYGRAIDMYKGALRINPDNRKTRQNLLLAIQKQQEQEQNQEQNNQEQQEEQQQEEQPQPQQQQQQQQQPMSQNAEQILQSVQNKENSTRRRNEQQPAATYSTDKPW